jgi:Protein of unknown function (DUF3285)
MNQDPMPAEVISPETISTVPEELVNPTESTAVTPPEGSYVKHAMRNMVRKRSKSLQHFFLSAVGLLGLFITLAYLTK